MVRQGPNYKKFRSPAASQVTDVALSTQRPQCRSFLVMTYFLFADCNILPKKELHLSLWVEMSGPPASQGAKQNSLAVFKGAYRY